MSWSETCNAVPNRELLLKYHSLMSSKSISAPLSFRPQSIPWLHEVCHRFIIVNALAVNCSHTIINSIEEYFPEFEDDGYCTKALTLRVTDYMRLSIQLLFRIFDARYDDSRNARAAQEDVIKNMTIAELAVVNLLLLIISVHYFQCSGTWQRPLVAQRRRECAYRELALIHGPQFIWASMFGSEKEKIWVKQRIKDWLTALWVYERSRGAVGSEQFFAPSLQYILLKEFCMKANCEFLNGLDSVFAFVKDLVVSSVANKQHEHLHCSVVGQLD
jgi:hypothetical protein